MDRSPLKLAALASAAVPGLDPASVQALRSEPGQAFDVAFVQDSQHRRWVIRAPRTQAAGAQMDLTVALLALLARRLPFSVPTPKGFVALPEGGRAAIYPYLAGRNLDFAALPAGPGIAAELGRAVGALHNADHAIFDEAGLPSYDADAYRTRRLSELDRAAATGHVPTGLLTRWERALENVSVWRFAPTPTHGDLTGDQVLAVFDDDEDAATGRIKAFTGWEDAKVADPADDFAALVAQASPAAVETVMEAYAHARVERPDPNLLFRARLASEMHQLTSLMVALADGDRPKVERGAASLRRLDEQVRDEESRQVERDGHRLAAVAEEASLPRASEVDPDLRPDEPTGERSGAEPSGEQSGEPSGEQLGAQSDDETAEADTDAEVRHDDDEAGMPTTPDSDSDPSDPTEDSTPPASAR